MTTPAEVVQVAAASPADTSVQVLNLWALVMLTFTNLGVVVWNIFSGPSKRNAAKLDQHASSIDGLGQRLGSLEQAQKSMPTRDDVHKIALTMVEMQGDVKAMRAEVEGNMAIMERLEAVVSRHENHLLKG
jgi:Protein of unknown function (DUF2730)